MYLRRIILGLSKSLPFSNRNFCSVAATTAVGKDHSSLTDKVKPKSIRRSSNEPNKYISNSPYPIPKNRELCDPQRPEQKPNQYYGESFLHSTVTFLIHNLSDLDTAMEYARLTAFTKTRGLTTTATCDLIISALCEAKRYKDAYDLFHYFFNESNIKLSVRCCNHIVKALCDDGRANEALQLHHHIRSDSNAPLTLEYQTYHILTKALYDAGKIDEALDLVKDVFSLRLIADPKVYDTAVSEILNEQDFDKIWKVCCCYNLQMIELDDDNSYPTVTSTAIIVTLMEYGFTRSQEETAMELYTSLIARPRAAIRDASKAPLLEVLFKYGKKNEAWSLFHNMFDMPTYMDKDADLSEPTNVMISELFKLGMSKEAIDTFAKMRARQSFCKNRFKHVPYGNIITKCCEDGLLSSADWIFRELLKENPSACKISTYEEMINAYLKAGRLDDALKTANKMVNANLRQVSSLLKT